MNVPGVAEYVEQGGQLVPKLPTSGMCSAGSNLTVPIVILGLAGAGAAAYFLFLR